MKTKAFTFIEGIVTVAIIAIIVGFVLESCRIHQAPPLSNYVTAHSPITIDGCQYLMVKISDPNKEFLSLIHKGNCTNHTNHTALKAEE